MQQRWPWRRNSAKAVREREGGGEGGEDHVAGGKDKMCEYEVHSEGEGGAAQSEGEDDEGSSVDGEMVRKVVMGQVMKAVKGETRVNSGVVGG